MGGHEGGKLETMYYDTFCCKKSQQIGNIHTGVCKTETQYIFSENYCPTHPTIFLSVFATMLVSEENNYTDLILNYTKMNFENPMKLSHPTRLITLVQNLEPYLSGIKGNLAKLRCGGRQIINYDDGNDNFRLYGIIDRKERINGHSESKMVRFIKKWLN